MTVHRNLVLKQHFTDAKQINDVMCHLLGNVDGLTVLEPSVGHGAFLSGLRGAPSRVDAVDVDGYAISVVRSKFDCLNLELFNADFVGMFVDGVLGSAHPVRRRLYDTVISNPPYGLYFDLGYRKRIKRLFQDLYARESYGLFFAFAVSRLVQGGRYAFLMPDTFLSTVNHRPLRALICSQAAPTHIIRFPSKLFETVNFGYGNLCIIAGNKRPLASTDLVQWITAFDGDTSLTISALEDAEAVSGATLTNNVRLGWSSAITDRHLRDHGSWPALGDIAECRTGIYTGDNKRFIGYDAARITRRLNGHAIEWVQQVCLRKLRQIEMQAGIEAEPHYVPLIRGGHREPFDTTAWAIRWDKTAIDFYKTDRRARFQNSKFYFGDGLSVPMVTTKRISAALMGSSVFDQGVVGVFPNDPAITAPLLLYLNSRHASETMKRMVNGSANNSANYLKRLPVPPFSYTDIQLALKVVEEAKLKKSLPPGACDTFVAKTVERLPS